MTPLNDVSALLEAQAPCLSLYQPTHRTHPQNQQDPIRYRNLVKSLDEALHRVYPAMDAAARVAQDRDGRRPAAHRARRTAQRGAPHHQGKKDAEMNVTEISALARHLFDTQGAKAIADAARKAAFFEQSGDAEQAKLWQRVEAILREMRGPHQS